jgi:hypothetical protein
VLAEDVTILAMRTREGRNPSEAHPGCYPDDYTPFVGMLCAIGLAVALAADPKPGPPPGLDIPEQKAGQALQFNIRQAPVLLHAELVYVGGIRAEDVRIGAEKLAADMRYVTVDRNELVLGARLLDKTLALHAGEHLDVRANRGSVRLELQLKWR